MDIVKGHSTALLLNIKPGVPKFYCNVLNPKILNTTPKPLKIVVFPILILNYTLQIDEF